MYDIIYSIIAHESPECVLDLIKNIFAFHPFMNVGIVIHTNIVLYEEVKRIHKKHVWIHPEPFDKQWCSYGIFLGHVCNFNYVNSIGIIAKYFITLASNCLFHKSVCLEFIEEKINEDSMTYEPPKYMPPIPEWCQTYQLRCNSRFFTCFAQHNIPFINSYHEGTIFEWTIFQKIVNFQDWWALKDIITIDFAFEEVLFPSLYTYFTKKHVRSLCTLKDITLETLKTLQNPCVKPVPRIWDHPIRVELRKKYLY
jgi:hypothetical protein